MCFYHGTSRKRARKILKEGLRIAKSLSGPYIYLSSKMEETKGYGRIILEVDVSSHDPNLEQIQCAWVDDHDWEYRYKVDIPPERIRRLL